VRDDLSLLAGEFVPSGTGKSCYLHIQRRKPLLHSGKEGDVPTAAEGVGCTLAEDVALIDRRKTSGKSVAKRVDESEASGGGCGRCDGCGGGGAP